MDKMSCFISKMLDFQLGPVSFSGHANASSAAGFDPMAMIPYMTIPFLIVLMAGLWMMDQYRRKTSL